jgi:hypothetical protein
VSRLPGCICLNRYFFVDFVDHRPAALVFAFSLQGN